MKDWSWNNFGNTLTTPAVIILLNVYIFWNDPIATVADPAFMAKLLYGAPFYLGVAMALFGPIEKDVFLALLVGSIAMFGFLPFVMLGLNVMTGLGIAGYAAIEIGMGIFIVCLFKKLWNGDKKTS